jgi:hypothetical protein
LGFGYCAHGLGIASVCCDMVFLVKPGVVKVWDAEPGQEKLSLKGHLGPVTRACFSLDGKRLASSSLDGTVKLWDVQTGREARTIEGRMGWVLSVAFSHDGKRIAASGQDRTVRVWDAEAGQQKCSSSRHAARIFEVAFSPDGSRIVCKDERGTRVDFDAATGSPLAPDRTPLPDNRGWARQPGGKLVAAPLDQEIMLFTPPTPLTPNERFLRLRAARLWHAAEATESEIARQWPSAAFHLERLHRSDPRVRQRLLAALKQADDTPLTQAIKRNLQATDAARAAAALGLATNGPLALPVCLPPAK